MNRILTAVLAAVAILLGGIFAKAHAEELNPTGQPEVKEGVTVGTTSTYHTDSVVPSQEGVMVGDGISDKRAAQLAKEKQLKEDDPWGGAITILSMCIVILALAVLSMLFLGFGRISSALQKRRKQAAHGPAKANEIVQDADSGEVIAAIAAALAEHFSGKHDMEDYILTIRSMKRSYSPWNSKIYNLRVLPQVKH